MDRFEPLSSEDIVAAAKRISLHIVRTPLIRAHEIEKQYGLDYPIFLKCEQFQRTRSFKERGAYNALLQQSQDILKQGVVTRSSGNFAQAFACASERLGIAAHIVMPTSAPKVKVANTMRWNPEVILHGTTHVEGMAKVQELIRERNYYYISPFDDRQIIAGQGTAAKEITEDCHHPISQFYCAVGGGGLMAGCALWMRSVNPRTEVVAVEPETANDFSLSFAKKTLMSINAPKSIADGLLTPSVGKENWPILRDCVDSVDTVTEDQIRESIYLLGTFQNIVVEPSGATAFAALKQRLERGLKPPEGAVVCMVSGGNVDMSFYLENAQKFQTKK